MDIRSNLVARCLSIVVLFLLGDSCLAAIHCSSLQEWKGQSKRRLIAVWGEPFSISIDKETQDSVFFYPTDISYASFRINKRDNIDSIKCPDNPEIVVVEKEAPKSIAFLYSWDLNVKH